MDAKPFIDRAMDDEGIAGGLPDEAAKPLLDWLVGELRAAITPLVDVAAAEAAAKALTQRSRSIGKVAEALIDADAAKARTIWRESGGTQSVDELVAKSPSEIMARLLAWKGKNHA